METCTSVPNCSKIKTDTENQLPIIPISELSHAALIRTMKRQIYDADKVIFRLRQRVCIMKRKILQREMRCKENGIRINLSAYRSMKSREKCGIKKQVFDPQLLKIYKNIEDDFDDLVVENDINETKPDPWIQQSATVYKLSNNVKLIESETNDVLFTEISETSFPDVADLLKTLTPVKKIIYDAPEKRELILEDGVLSSTKFYNKFYDIRNFCEDGPTDRQNPINRKKCWKRMTPIVFQIFEICWENWNASKDCPEMDNAAHFVKLYEPLNAEERRLKKREAQRIRELSVAAALAERRNNRNRSKNEGTSSEAENTNEEITTFIYDLSKIDYVSLTNKFPISFMWETVNVVHVWNEGYFTPWRTKFDFKDLQ